MGHLLGLCRRRSRYYFRCRVPTALVGRIGRRELSRSLQTEDSRTARKLWCRLAIMTAELWTAVQQAVEQHEIDALVAGWLSARLDIDRQQRVQADFAAAFAAHTGMTPHAAAAYLIGSDAEGELPRWQRAVRDSDWAAAAPLAGALIRDRKLSIAEDSDAYRMLCMGLTIAAGELEGIRAARSLGDWSDAPVGTAQVPPYPPSAETAVPASPELGGLIDEYLAEKRRRGETLPKRLLDFNAALGLFKEWCGADTPIAEIDRAKVGAFRTLMSKLPNNHTKRFPGLPLSEIVEKAEAEGLPPRDASTVNQKYLSLVCAFFDWVVGGGVLKENPATGIRAEVRRTRVRKQKRGVFSTEHLAKIYAAPLFTGCRSARRIYEPGSVLVQDHRRWLPLLSLFTGARLNELCQLRVKDVREVDGVLCLDINEDEGRRVKTLASRRLVPLHAELHRLGFPAYVASLPAGSPLWPELSGSSTGYGSDPVSKWFVRFFKETLGEAERRDAKLSHHSYRHTMKDRLREVGVSDRIQDAFLGHETSHVSAGYGAGYRPPAILREIDKVRFEGLSLEHLHVSPHEEERHRRAA